MKVETIKEIKHNELLVNLKPLIDFIQVNDFSYFLVAGKDGICSRYLSGNYDDLRGMIEGMIESHPQFIAIFQDIMNDRLSKINS